MDYFDLPPVAPLGFEFLLDPARRPPVAPPEAWLFLWEIARAFLPWLGL